MHASLMAFATEMPTQADITLLKLACLDNQDMNKKRKIRMEPKPQLIVLTGISKKQFSVDPSYFRSFANRRIQYLINSVQTKHRLL